MTSGDLTDLTSVRGIGPKKEARLKDAGIEDLGTLARTPASEVAALLAGMPGGRPDAAMVEGWLTQAAALAAAEGQPGAGDTEQGSVPDGETARHSFTVEIRLPLPGRDAAAASVTIRHVNTRDEETWNGWDPARAAAFVEERAGLRAVPPPGKAPPAPEPAPALPPERPRSRPAHGARTRAYAVVPSAGPVLGGGVAEFTATLAFDAGSLDLPPAAAATVSADVLARRLPESGGTLVGSAAAEIGPGERVLLEIPCRFPREARVSGPVAVFALVRVRAAAGGEWRAPRKLSAANLAISPYNGKSAGVI